MILEPATRPRAALVRVVPDSFAQMYGPLRIEAARAQHTGYVAALRSAGVEVCLLPTDEAHPDCHFVEDNAVVVDDEVLLTHMGRPDRRGEEQALVAPLLEMGLTVRPLDPPATLEGGDVLRIGRCFYVGLSGRTNPAGIAALKAFCRRHGYACHAVEHVGGLHLKSGCSACAGNAVLVDPTQIDAGAFAGLVVLAVPEAEGYAANCLAIGNRVFLPSGYLKTAALVERAGLSVSLLPMSTFCQADGALTCLSLLIGEQA